MGNSKEMLRGCTIVTSVLMIAFAFATPADALVSHYLGGSKPTNCSQVRRLGYTESGMYRVYGGVCDVLGTDVQCDMSNSDGSLTEVLDNGATIVNPVNPYVAPINMQIGTVVSIYGKIRKSAQQVQIAFMESESASKIPFWFNVRFRGYLSGPKVVRNSYNGYWVVPDEESSADVFPFVHTGLFEVVITCGDSAFDIKVNNHHFATFNHRYPIEQNRFMSVKADVDIMEVHVE